jgi:Protein of unknown function (DUF3570)
MRRNALRARVVTSLWVIGLVAVLVVVVARLDWAQSTLYLQLHSFGDTRGVTVLSPLVDLDKDFSDRTGLRVKFGVDAVAAASDACARCHPQGAHDRRIYADFGLRRKFGATTLEVGGEISRENFYASESVTASLSRDFNRGNTTVAGAYSFSLNSPQLHPSRNVEQQLSHDASVALTQTLSKSTIVQLSYDFNRVSGYQSSPFLRTSVNGEMMLGVVPDLRNRQAFGVRFRQALPADTYLQADFRHYFDSWSVGSNTLSLGASHFFSPAWLVGFTYRWYDQTGAFFYQPQYFGTPEYFTGDYRLAPFNSGLYTGRVVYTPEDGLLGLPKGTALELQYDRYVGSNQFQAAVFSAGLRIPF